MTPIGTTLIACALLLPQHTQAFLAAASVDLRPISPPVTEDVCLEMLPQAEEIMRIGYLAALAARGRPSSLQPPPLPNERPAVATAVATTQ